MALKNVLVLFGGVSTEHLVSCRSAYNIIRGLRQAKLHVMIIGITKNGEWLPYHGPDEALTIGRWEDLARAEARQAPSRPWPDSPRAYILAMTDTLPDCIFPAVHGINCEDGVLQGLLEMSGIPYVGSGVLASAMGMDKLQAKILFRHARLPQCRYLAVERQAIERDAAAAARKVAAKIGFPCFLKPSNGGSSVGTCRATDEQSLAAALIEVAAYDRKVIVEEFVKAREIEVAVLGNDRPKAAMIGEVVTQDQIEYYDYEAKYFKADAAAVVIPADIPADLAARVRRYAIKAYKALGCSGLSRVDFFLDRDSGQLMINEVNTLPGFTAISVYPQAFTASGMPVHSLVKKLCLLAMQEHADKTRKELI